MCEEPETITISALVDEARDAHRSVLDTTELFSRFIRFFLRRAGGEVVISADDLDEVLAYDVQFDLGDERIRLFITEAR